MSMTLSEYLAANKMSYQELARMCGVHRTTIWRVAHGKRKPEWPLAQKIMVATDGQVTPDSFLPPELRESASLDATD